MIDLEKILPHNNPMILIDKVLDVNLKEKYLISEVTIKDSMIFYNKGLKGVSSLVGIEFMAQTIGCYAYYKNGEKEPAIGLLLGSRVYKNYKEVFGLNETYTIKATETFDNDGLSSFDCYIYDNLKEVCASASLNVYQNDSVKGIIENAK